MQVARSVMDLIVFVQSPDPSTITGLPHGPRLLRRTRQHPGRGFFQPGRHTQRAGQPRVGTGTISPWPAPTAQGDACRGTERLTQGPATRLFRCHFPKSSALAAAIFTGFTDARPSQFLDRCLFVEAGVLSTLLSQCHDVGRCQHRHRRFPWASGRLESQFREW